MMTMKPIFRAVAAFLAVSSVATAFVPSIHPVVVTKEAAVKPLYGYVPDGVSPEQWRKIKENENAKAKQKNLGAYGPSTFQSRSLRAFQEDLEKGKVRTMHTDES
jgi:urocanate hydratase